jgi:Type ISP C-terminal specificity domain/N-6 DNA Methylase
MALRGGTVRAYLQAIQRVATIPGATEHTYRAALGEFLVAAARELGFGQVTVRSELRLADVGQPDLQVVNGDGVAIGYGETKQPGTAARFAEVLESEQVTRYRSTLENLLVTDFLRLTLFRPEVGRLDVVLAESAAKVAAGSTAVSAGQLAQAGQLLSAFFSATAPMATSAEMLADGLARRATLLRDAIRELLRPAVADGDALRKLWDFYRRTLMSDMEADDFADTYAQTLTYALFLVRMEAGPVADLEAAWKAIPPDIPILRSAIEPLRVGGAMPEPMTVWLTDQLHLLNATPDAVIGSIGHPSAGSPDPILYFYEHFLAAYDRLERIRKGVYYTPRPLVDYVVHAVNDSLKRDFGKALGLADKDVRLLDPAVGTGTFPLAAAQLAVDEVATSLGSGVIRAVLEDHVLQHFFGFELLPAPYTIAHVKMALFAHAHHVRFLNKRASIYLTNTLGDPLARADDGGLLAFFVPGLIEEAHAAERVKSDEPVLAIIGNPPWSATSHNKQPEIERLFAAWKTIDGRATSPLIKDARIALNDDYLKFMRWAVWKLFEQKTSPGHGILAFVTNHGFINGRIHRGIRKALLDRFDEAWIFNLHGNQRLWVKGVTDEKVFPDVQQGVALSVFVKRPGTGTGRAVVHHREMRGTRAEKYAAADSVRLGGPGWATVEPEAPYWSFAPASEVSDYAAWPSMTSIFPVNSSGVQSSHDDLVSDVEPEALRQRIMTLGDASISSDDLRDRYDIQEHDRWRWTERRAAMAAFDEGRIIPWLYRLFDRRYVDWDPALIAWPRTKFMQHLLPKPFGHGGEQRIALVVQRARPITTIATVTRGIATAHVTSQWDHVYPLHLAEGSEAADVLLPVEQTWRENLDPELVARLLAAYGTAPSVEQIGWFTFGILSAPAYRSRFAAELAIDHPRIPLPIDHDVFGRMAELGERLGRAHLLEAPIPADVRFTGEGTNRVEAIHHDAAGSAVRINATQQFTGVSPEAWSWGGSFRPLEHFLTDRKDRVLDIDQVRMHLQAITAVRTAIELAPDLDSALAEILAAPLAFESTG